MIIHRLSTRSLPRTNHFQIANSPCSACFTFFRDLMKQVGSTSLHDLLGGRHRIYLLTKMSRNSIAF